MELPDRGIRIVIARVTQTDDDVNQIITGQKGKRLNQTGREQAQQLAERLSKFDPIVGLISSDQPQAVEMARTIGRVLKIRASYTPNLREIDLGELTGMTLQELLDEHPKEKYDPRNRKFDFREFGGEHFEAVNVRHREIIYQALDEKGDSGEDRELPVIILVGHQLAFSSVFLNEYVAATRLHAQGKCQRFIWPYPGAGVEDDN